MVQISISSRSRSIQSLSEDFPSLSVNDIVQKIASSNNLPESRIRLTRKTATRQEPLGKDQLLSDFFDGPQLKQGIDLYVKDLGPQIGYQTVFFLEYLGPILIQTVIHTYFVRWKKVTQLQTQQLAYILSILHFTKREYESFAVHRFSNATMPLFNLFKNSAHYWILLGVNLAFFVYSQDLSKLASAGRIKKFIFHVNSFPTYINVLLVAIWAFAQASNYITHVKLSKLRTGDSKAYVIPKGYGFDLLVCPNYVFESLGWLTFSVLVGNWSAWFFFVVGTGQMYIWAAARKERYLKTFGDDFKKLKRAVYIPYIL